MSSLLTKKQDSSEDGGSVKLPKGHFACNSDGTHTTSDEGKPITLPKGLFGGNSDGTPSEEEVPPFLSVQEEQDRINAVHVPMSAVRKLELIAEAFGMIQIDQEELEEGYIFQITKCELAG